MPESRWIHVLSLELGWMNPAQARAYIAAANAAGILQPDGDALRLAFDARTIDAPRGFRPDPDSVPRAITSHAPPPRMDPFMACVERIGKQTGKQRQQILEDVSNLQDQLGGLLTAEAAVLWVAHEAGMDVRREAAEALNPQ